MTTQPTTMLEVIARLDAIIEETRRAGSRLGYFPALYREVTAKIAEGIGTGLFDSPERMGRLAVTFANRYLQAYDDYRCGQPVTESWRLAFDATREWSPTVVQHLLLAISAHINLDLGIAAAQTSPGAELPALKPDFDKINGVLANMIDGVERELAKVWPMLALADRLAGRIDENIARFSIDRARDAAWGVAGRLAPLDRGHWPEEIERLDQTVVLVGKLIRNPGIGGSLLLTSIRLGERGTVPEIIDILRDRATEVSRMIRPAPREAGARGAAG